MGPTSLGAEEDDAAVELMSQEVIAMLTPSPVAPAGRFMRVKSILSTDLGADGTSLAAQAADFRLS